MFKTSAQGETEVLSFFLTQCTNQIWHAYLAGASPGLSYAYRVHGPSKPGLYFDAQQFLLDPYAREFSGRFVRHCSAISAHGLRCQVVHDDFDWGDDQPPATPWHQSLIYEAHVKGLTRLHPDVPENLQGTYAGLASPAVIRHLQQLGVTAIDLLPVHYFLDEQRLLENAQTNYWGYNSLGFFALEPRYASELSDQSARHEFRSMVRALHAAGIEVILDVVFNHTAESDEKGPTLSFRGIDNASYYCRSPEHPEFYENHTGCGNTLNTAHPRVLQLVMDSLRYWVSEMHVDGFRFDLAATLTRDSAFLAAIAQDPLLAGVKMIAEPWDLGPDGYRLGRFLPGWGEWNDRFRDDVRAFWLTHSVDAAALAQRLAGSSEIFSNNGRAPQAGINFIAAHDGFTLRDVVSYRDKHNTANGENNRDGHNHNLSTNCGLEGETDAPGILRARRNLQRALLATLYVAQGVPMLQAGDELGRTQAGNNNAYCQDNPLTWIDWAGADQELLAFSSHLSALRARFPQLTQRTWLSGQAQTNGQRDIIWWHPDGREMHGDDWHSPNGIFGFILAPVPAALDAPAGKTLLVLINRAPADYLFKLPPGAWQQLCATSAQAPFASLACASICSALACSVQIFSQD